MSSEMGRRPERSAEKSNFSVTVSLLSQYIKEKGSLADLALGMPPAPKVKSETFRPPTTMSLLPGVDVSGDGAAYTEDDVSDRNAPKSMELFPQRAGFGPSAPAMDGNRKAADAREADRTQLTIFYGGKVLVFDNFPAEKAKDLMQYASKGSSTTQNVGFVPPSSAAVAANPVDHRSSNFVSTVQGHPQRPTQPSASDLPIARKASLHRFLEKRKDRINAKAPYQVNGSSAFAATPKPEDEEKQWLGLGPQMPKSNLSSERRR